MNLLGSAGVPPGSLGGPKETLSRGQGVASEEGLEMSDSSRVEEETGVHSGLGLRHYMHPARFEAQNPEDAVTPGGERDTGFC